MNCLSHHKSLSWFTRLTIFSIMLGYGVLTGFSPVLHNHDLDLNPTHKDCAPCHWSQSSNGLETQSTDLSIQPHFQKTDVKTGSVWDYSSLFSLANRGPPFLS